MIDLHLHTHYSDGTLSPEELVIQAKKNGMDTIAITDHDGMGGIEEGIAAGKKYGIRVIPGIELSTEDDKGAYMHILGYCFDVNNKELKDEVEKIRQKRVERNEKLLCALNEIGCDISTEDLKLRAGQDYVGKPIIALALMNKGYISTPREAFKEGQFMRSDVVKKVHREKISTMKAIELIKKANGKAVLAHPMKIAYLGKDETGDFFQKLDRLLLKLKIWGLEGMECYYSKHLIYETERLIELSEKHGLFITAGSDFHGFEFDQTLSIGTIIENNSKNNINLSKIDYSTFCKNML